MIYGIGVDIVEVARIARAHERWGERFAAKILGPYELTQFRATRRPVRFLAMRFAAKEAASKALGTGFKQGVSPCQIEVHHAPSGKPSLHFLDRVAERVEREGITASFVSMADERDYAIAHAILECGTDAR